MRIIVTGGGTAGHVTPLLAVASELKRQMPNSEICYVGNFGDKFAKMAEEYPEIDGHWRIMAGKFRRYHGISKWVYIKDLRIMLRNFRDLFYFVIGFLQSVWLFLWWRPNVIFVKGGFVGLPVGLAGALLRIPIVTHDSDVVPGLTNRILSKYAKFTAVAMPAKYYTKYAQERIRYTGLPVRNDFVKVNKTDIVEAKRYFAIPDKSTVVAVVGGSLGAIRLNNAILAIAEELLLDNPDLYILHVTGAQQFKDIDDYYRSLPEALTRRIQCWPFYEAVYLITAGADIVVSRAGSSVHELSIQQKCVILVPNPVLTGGHQTINARVLSDQNSVAVVTEKQLAESQNKVLRQTIQGLLSDDKRRNLLADNLSKLAVPNAAKKIVDVILEATKK